MAVVIVLSEYLDDLRRIQKDKPVEQRLPIPTMAQFAEVSGVSRPTFSDFANGKNKRVNLDLIANTLKLLRAWGHDPQLTDIIQETD